MLAMFGEVYRTSLLLDRVGNITMIGKSRFQFYLLFVSILAALLLTACGGSEPAATLVPTAPAAATATPAAAVAATATLAAQAAVSPLRAPESPLPTPAVKPETSATAGAVVGRLILDRPEGEMAVTDALLGLAKIILDDQGLPRASGYTASEAPRTTTDSLGRFVLNNVKPGTYTLILDGVVTQNQLADEATGDTIMFEVKPGEVVDLGTLRYTTLPGFP